MPASNPSTTILQLNNINLPNLSSIDVPFLLNFSNLEFDKAVIFIIAVMLTITVNAEAQAFMATMLGDAREDAKDRFHFNPLLHINLAGLLCFAVAGFGWSKQIKLDTDKFKHPAIALMIVRFAGAFANLLLASIAGSILFIMKKWNLEDQVFSIVIAVNIMVFVYSCIPVPPLAGGYIIFSIISLFFPTDFIRSTIKNFPKYIIKAIPYIFVAFLILVKIKKWTFMEEALYPVVRYIFKFITG
ncbi:MAG: hypothetical protein HQK73_02655 [Desulfamplus sp.]|nr:hypothetical protein [Desulfamplus sp.]MBF0411914.1 hypothetical protein [Desulfamplus sp.]